MTKLVALLVLVVSFGVSAAPVSPLHGYQHTDLKDMNEVNRVFRSMKKNTEYFSQCFNRALTWVYDMDKDFGIKSRKVIIHYSQKFNKELDDKWGFHIAPLVSVNGEDIALDPKFFKKPVKKLDWIKNFIGKGERKLEKKRQKLVKKLRKFRKRLRKVRNGKFVFGLLVTPRDIKRKIREIKNEMNYLEVSESKPADIQCKKITNIEELDYNLNGSWCYYQEVSMYYWGIPQLRLLNYGQTTVPNREDLPSAQIRGARYVQNTWDMDQVWQAREEAFANIDELWPYEWLEKEYQDKLMEEKLHAAMSL